MAKDRFLAQGVGRASKRQRSGKKIITKGARHPRGDNGSAALMDDGTSSDDQIGDTENLEHMHGDDSLAESSDDEMLQLETAADKRLRLAKQYIGKVQQATAAAASGDDYDAAQIDRDLVAERLVADANERSGRWSRRIAASLARPLELVRTNQTAKTTKPAMAVLTRSLPGGRDAVTCVAVTPDGRYVYVGAKGGTVAKWEWRRNGGNDSARVATLRGHSGAVLAVAVSSDGQFVATGGRDRRIRVWTVADDRLVGVFSQHKDAVTGLAFGCGRQTRHQLYSCAADRMVKLWNVAEMAYIDTLFGHQDGAVAIAALRRDQALTAGARDRSLRLWRVADDSQLVFRAGATTDRRRLTRMLASDAADHAASPAAVSTTHAHADLARRLAASDTELREHCVDAIAMVDEETFVSGGDSGALSLWSAHKKKPVFVVHVAHGLHPAGNHPDPASVDAEADADADSDPNPPRARWITALAAVPFTDLFFSASSDGFVRMWQLRPGKAPGFDLVNVIPVAGCVNGLSVCEVSPSGSSDADAVSTSLSPVRDIVLAVAVAPEPRLGRWEKTKARNAVKVFQFQTTIQQQKQQK
ncbi:pre-rRNA processing protein [Coemansia sp. RSA 1200]|nr:pre-rRNA processing protein [Coemansia sp. RSA 1200]